MSELIGRKVGQYEITGLLGKGGMAVVYRAHQGTIVRDVAIKLIKPDLADEGFIARFHREARTIAALDHPHILKIHDFGREDDLPYLVMELKSGGSLAHKIAKMQGRINVEDVAKYLDQIAPALDYAHSKGVIHRDIKPQNVLLDESDNAFLTDFGIAKLLNDSTVLTHSGLQMGTPGYMAPEQWYGHQIDSRTDLYALAVMIYEILTGKVPFDGDTPAVLMYQQLNEAPLPLRTLRPDLPVSLEKVLIKAMAKQPDQRYQSAAAFAAAFQEGLRGKTPPGIDVAAALRPIALPNTLSSSRAHPTVEHRAVLGQMGQKRVSILVIGAGIIALLGMIIILLSQQDEIGVSAASALITPSQVIIAANATETIPSSMTATTTPSVTLTSTATLMPSATSSPSHTPTNAATNTVTHTFTAVKTLIPPTLTPTPNEPTLIALILATETQRAADIIASYTLTPSFTPSETPDLVNTARAAANQTMTAVVVASFTQTFTPTPTATATATFTPSLTPSNTYTPTLTPTITSTIHQGAFFVVTSNDPVIYAWEGPWRGDKSVAQVLKGDRLPIIAAKKGMDVFVWCIVRLPSGTDVWISTRVGEIQPGESMAAGIPIPMTIPAAKLKPTATMVPTEVPTSIPGVVPPVIVVPNPTASSGTAVPPSATPTPGWQTAVPTPMPTRWFVTKTPSVVYY